MGTGPLSVEARGAIATRPRRIRNRNNRGHQPAQRIADEETVGQIGAGQRRLRPRGRCRAARRAARRAAGRAPSGGVTQHAVALDEQRGEAALGQQAVGVVEHHLERARGLRARRRRSARSLVLWRRRKSSAATGSGTIATVDRRGRRAAAAPTSIAIAPIAPSSSRMRRGVAQPEGRGLQFVARGVAVEGEAERLGARLHPREMALEQRQARRRDRTPSSRSGRTAAAPAVTNAPLARHSRPFLVGVAVGDDARAEPERRVRVAAGIASVRIATLNIASPSGVEPADRAGIGAARRARLDLGDRPPSRGSWARR